MNDIPDEDAVNELLQPLNDYIDRATEGFDVEAAWKRLWKRIEEYEIAAGNPAFVHPVEHPDSSSPVNAPGGEDAPARHEVSTSAVRGFQKSRPPG
ncbi:hypothetical protein [Nocardia wallacei]|uniref:hypothetical protein n=1 Tax=Nocardia wallacei TaxID=480035 RepID=UPI0024549264|nr:hypothetical protein [Nocardia wallacei]